MNKCGIGNLSGKDFGSATMKGTVFSEYQALSDCQRDITRHFYTLKVRGSNVSPEKEPILQRVDKKKIHGPLFGILPCRMLFGHDLVFFTLGISEGTADINIGVCARHRYVLGILFRGRKKIARFRRGSPDTTPKSTRSHQQ